jgi:hypothetical protein
MAAAVSGSAHANDFVDDRDYFLIETNGPFELVDGYTTSLDYLEQQSLENISQARTRTNNVRGSACAFLPRTAATP